MNLWIYEDGSTTQNNHDVEADDVMDAIEAGNLQVFRFENGFFQIANVDTDEEDVRTVAWSRA